MDKHLDFDVDRGKDENRIISQLVTAYNVAIIQSSQTYNPVDINATFSCVEVLFQNFRHRIKDNERIKKLIDEYKAEYFEAVGIKTKPPGSDRGSMQFLAGLNEKVKTIFVLVRGGLEDD